MPDSFIYQLNESTTSLKNSDYLVFDILDSVNFTYDTKKISYKTLSETLTSNISPYLDSSYIRYDNNVITLSSNLFTVNVPCTFNSSVSLSNNTISNLADPFNLKDAVNVSYLQNYLKQELNSYIPLTGGSFSSNVSFKGFSEKYLDVISSSVLSLYLSTGNNFNIDLNTNVNEISVFNTPSTTETFSITFFIKQLGTNSGGYFDINWVINGTPVRWPQSASPTITKNTNKIDIISITKMSNDWFGFIGGQEF